MPGLFGIVGPQSQEELQALAQAMAQTLRHEDWYQVDLYVEDGLALGRVHLGFLNPQPQPAWNEDRSLCIVMEGEVYDYEHEKRWLIERGHRFHLNNDPEYVLHLYEEYGEDFAGRLNGAFVAAIWDTMRRWLLIVNDRFGLQSLCYTWQDNRLLFAGRAIAFLNDPGFTPRLDLTGMVQYLSFEHLLGDQTLLEGVRLLPPASLLIWREGQPSLRSYWEFQYPAQCPYRGKAELIEEWEHYFRQAIERQLRGEDTVGVLLSGGMDSRAVLAGIGRRSFPVHTFTFGILGCDDDRLAREVAAVSGAHHHFFELRPDYLLQVVEEGVRLTDGMKSCVHMHVLAPLPQVAQHVRVLFTGSLGDSLMGTHLTRDMLAIHDRALLAKVLFQRYNSAFRESELANLFTDTLYPQVQGEAFDSFREALLKSRSNLSANVREHYSIRQNDRRWILEGQRLLRSQTVVRTPFYDTDLVDFMLTVPPGWRLEGYLYKQAFAKAFPTLAKVPLESTGLPLTTSIREVYIRADRQFRWWLRAKGIKCISVPERQPYADYNGWMRTVLRPWVEETLLSKRSLERGYFDPEYVRNLVAEHMNGANHARKLGVLLSLELWHHLFLD